jgi:type I restriction enzyme M protein
LKKGSTKEIWYYEHKFPEGQKSYSKTKPFNLKNLMTYNTIGGITGLKMITFLGKFKYNDLKDWDLDIKNPNRIQNY